jgi:hypothetical protein
MKSLAIAALVAAELAVAVQPAMAADLGDAQAASQRQGAFAGARLRVPLGGGEKAGKARAALTMAPVLHGRQADGSMRTRFGEGVELAFTGKPRLSLAGRPVSQIAPGRTGPDGRKLGTSTGKGLLIVGGVVVLTLGALALLIVAQE